MPDLRHGPVLVVRHHLDHDRYACRSVSFIEIFFIGNTRKLSRALHDRLLDVVMRHVYFLCLVDSCAKTRIAFGIAAAKLVCSNVLLDYLGEYFSSVSVGVGFLMFYLGPFGVSSHK